MVNKAALASRIRSVAAEKGISIADLEKRAGYSPGMVSRWAAAGDEDFGALTKLTSLAEGLGVSVDYLLAYECRKETDHSQKAAVSGGTETLLAVTAQGGLEWAKLKASDCEEAGLHQLCGMESVNGRALAEAWLSSYGGCRFVIAAFCDNVQDPGETIEVALFYFVGSGLPLRQADAGSQAVKELYVELRAREALADMQRDKVSAD